jgi:hypothetical protein
MALIRAYVAMTRLSVLASTVSAGLAPVSVTTVSGGFPHRRVFQLIEQHHIVIATESSDHKR